MLRLMTCALLASAAMSQSVSYFSVALDGAQENPPVATSARGWGVVRFDAATNSVRIFAHTEALSGPATAAHMHSGPVGTNGGVIVGLTLAGSNITGGGVISAANAAQLVAGNMYLNVHTAANPGGEIRGQIVTAKSTRLTGVLSGAQENPPVASAATGTVVAFLHEPDNRLVYTVETSGLANVTAAHVHTAPSGQNGGVLFGLNGGGGQYCGVSDHLTAAQVATLLADGNYVNVHTAANPGGEIRAQLRKDQGDHFAGGMSGAQEVPPAAGNGVGHACLTVQPDGTIAISGAFAGLSGPPLAAHVHNAAAGLNGGIVFALTIAGNSLSGTHTPSAADLVNLRSGQWYVNVHTALNPGGEIRGQLLAADLPTTFGRGCVGSNNVAPEIGASGFPCLTGSFGIDLYGAAAGVPCVLAIGFSRDAASGGAIGLPVELTSVGVAAPGCFALVDPAATNLTFSDGDGCASLTLSLPLTPSLAGLHFYSQWLVLDGPANGAGVVFSSALDSEVQ